MTTGFTIRLRGAPPALVCREFLCLEHGTFDTLADPRSTCHPCPECDATCDRAMSAPAVHTQFVVSVTRGKDDPKPHARSMDTRALAEGQSLAEWKKERAKVWEADRRERVKKALE